MSTQKRAPSKQTQAPNNEAVPPRREEQQRSGKVDPRGSNQTPYSAPTGKRSDQEDFDGPPTDQREPQKKGPPSDIPKRQ